MKIKKRSLPLKVDFSPVNQPEKNDIAGRRLKGGILQLLKHSQLDLNYNTVTQKLQLK